MSVLKPVIISPPVGTHLNFDWATSVKGTFTADPIPGNRWLQTLKTIRPERGGWVNDIGLLNDGIDSVDSFSYDHLYSITAVKHNNPDREPKYGWYRLLGAIPGGRMIELNFGCPNANTADWDFGILGLFKLKCKLVVIKLPAADVPAAMQIVDTAVAVGINHFHCCNTVPTHRGGRSGQRLKYYSIQLIHQIKQKHPDVNIIGGGGIYKPRDVQDYRRAGATHFSLSTIWFTPWRIPAVTKEIHKISSNA